MQNIRRICKWNKHGLIKCSTKKAKLNCLQRWEYRKCIRSYCIRAENWKTSLLNVQRSFSTTDLDHSPWKKHLLLQFPAYNRINVQYHFFKPVGWACQHHEASWRFALERRRPRSFFRNKHSPHQLEKSRWYFFSSRNSELLHTRWHWQIVHVVCVHIHSPKNHYDYGEG